MRPAARVAVLVCMIATLAVVATAGFQSDELLLDEEDSLSPPAPVDTATPTSTSTSTPSPPTGSSSRRRFSSSDQDSQSKIQFTLDHAFGPLDSDFAPAGTFSARIKPNSHGSLSLIKLRFSRNSLSDSEKQKFQKLLEEDDYYRIRLPSNVLSPPGKDFVTSSVKARCLPRDGLDELFFIHMDGTNILAVNYGAPGACPYPRQLKLPAKWSFNSHTVLKNADAAPRTPLFAEATIIGGENVEGEAVLPQERSFWAKYWMYLIPLGLIVMNAMTQAMNVPEEGQAGAQQGGAPQRAPSSAVRRR